MVMNNKYLKLLFTQRCKEILDYKRKIEEIRKEDLSLQRLPKGSWDRCFRGLLNNLNKLIYIDK